MCTKLPYLNPRIDECLRPFVKCLNAQDTFRTVASCCGHDKYPATIIFEDVTNGKVYEWHSEKELPRIAKELQKQPRGRKIYQKDAEGYYFLPESSKVI